MPIELSKSYLAEFGHEVRNIGTIPSTCERLQIRIEMPEKKGAG